MVWIQVGMATSGRKKIQKTGIWTGRNKNWNKEFDQWTRIFSISSIGSVMVDRHCVPMFTGVNNHVELTQ